MTDTQEILKKAIKKAIDGGWEGFNYHDDWFIGPSPDWFLKARYCDDVHQFVSRNNVDFELNELIFNHDFAKALWGDKGYVELPEIGGGTFTHWLDEDFNPSPTQAWQFYLQQMVVADDPIKYLGEHLNG